MKKTSCKICHIHKGTFKSEAQFGYVREKISALIVQELFVKIEAEDIASPFLVLRYKCKNCNEVWVLTLPDQAFRGDMQPEQLSAVFSSDGLEAQH
jgi:hypothetical protein